MSVKIITPQRAIRWLDAGKGTLVDVREPDEYEHLHIPDALSLPLGRLRALAPAALPDRDAPVLVYCQSGVRSAQGAAVLDHMGYTQVYDLGGIVNWPYETV